MPDDTTSQSLPILLPRPSPDQFNIRVVSLSKGSACGSAGQLVCCIWKACAPRASGPGLPLTSDFPRLSHCPPPSLPAGTSSDPSPSRAKTPRCGLTTHRGCLLQTSRNVRTRKLAVNVLKTILNTYMNIHTHEITSTKRKNRVPNPPHLSGILLSHAFSVLWMIPSRSRRGARGGGAPCRSPGSCSVSLGAVSGQPR